MASKKRRYCPVDSINDAYNHKQQDPIVAASQWQLKLCQLQRRTWLHEPNDASYLTLLLQRVQILALGGLMLLCHMCYFVP